jgi:hypothetical protein
MAQQKDARIISMVREAHRISHVALNKIHGSRLIENHEVSGLANSLIAGRHVIAGSDSGREVDHAGADANGANLLDEAYGTDGERSSGSY